MDANLRKCFDSLNENEPEIRSTALQILLRVTNNVLSFPSDVKYRKIHVGNASIMEKLLMACGAIECLFEMGFIEDGEYFTLPVDDPLRRLRQVQKMLLDLHKKVLAQANEGRSEKKDNRKSTEETISSVKSLVNSNTNASKSKPQAAEKQSKIDRRKNFLARIVMEFDKTLAHENPQLQSKARRVVPLEKLQIGAIERLRQLQKEMKNNASIDSSKSSQPEVTLEDFLLVELLGWFKNDFFTWVNSPDCDVCKKPTQYDREESSTDWRISRIEIYKCSNCGMEVQFPRYTDAGVLLRTRKGRCGEWANAFTLICRTLGFDARLVHDETDHVWTEVWSIGLNRWVHADPCENAMDRPLLYERGWKKKLTYVIAYSKDEVQDVTWRYTRDQPAVMKRRTLCKEADLCSLICRLTNERQSAPGYSEARKRFVTKRRAMELVELMPAPPGCEDPSEDDEKDYGGRVSGSLAWRSARGETEQKPHVPQIWKIPTNTTNFQLRYYSARDEYETASGSTILEQRAGWQNGLETTEGGVFRKEEKDWKMSYLCRSPNQKVGKVTWTLAVEESGAAIKKVTVRAICGSFHTGKIDWKIRGAYRVPEKQDVVLSIENSENFQTNSLHGAASINLTAELSGGDGKDAWQHAQIFRQSLDDKDSFSMSIEIETFKCTDEKM